MFYIGEFLERKKLSKLGFTQNLNDLDGRTAFLFSIITDEFARLEQKEMEKSRQSNSPTQRGRRR